MAEFDVHFHSQQGAEHAAWLDFCDELTKLGVNINDEEALANAVRLWGEELAELRHLDPVEQHRENALAEKREAYRGKHYTERVLGLPWQEEVSVNGDD
jgi:hypothetical protein